MEFVDLVIRGQVKLGNVDAEEKEEDEEFFEDLDVFGIVVLPSGMKSTCGCMHSGMTLMTQSAQAFIWIIWLCTIRRASKRL